MAYTLLTPPRPGERAATPATTVVESGFGGSPSWVETPDLEVGRVHEISIGSGTNEAVHQLRVSDDYELRFIGESSNFDWTETVANDYRTYSLTLVADEASDDLRVLFYIMEV